jgi:hypothetical protein
MLFDLAPRGAAAHVDLAVPLDAHLLFREIGADAAGRASTALALRTMTHSRSAGPPVTSARSEPQLQCAILVIELISRAFLGTIYGLDLALCVL